MTTILLNLRVWIGVILFRCELISIETMNRWQIERLVGTFPEKRKSRP